MSEQISQCEHCQQRYTLFRRKKQCDLCGQIFCSKCVPKPASFISVNNSRACSTCLLITNTRTTHDQLASIRIKHLRAYLIHSKLVSRNRLESCVEKQDLINLIETRNEQVPDDSYVFVERHDARNNQISNDNTTTTTTNISNNHQREEVIVEPTTNRNEQASSSPSPSPPASIPRNENPIIPPPPPPPPKANCDRITLSDLSSLESIHNLTIRQLKDILIQNFVSTKGCVEKRELIQKVELLYQDQQKELNTIIVNGQSDENMCKVCMDATIDCVFLDCGHLCTCVQCGKKLSECPLCRSYIVRVVRVFKS